MTLAKPKHMIKRFTYKEFTLLLGVIVALIIVFALWIRQPAKSFSRTTKLLEWKLNIPTDTNVKNLVNAFEELP
jgi:ABC-type cobalamin transport system permease subunit